MSHKGIIEQSNFKHPSLGRHPTKPVFTTTSQFDRIQQIKESKEIHLPNYAPL
jgi:hypothetical protein